MIKLACKIPRRVVLACSGGRDSMSALEFLVRGRREVTVAYFNHDTEHGQAAEEFLHAFCDRQKLTFVSGRYKHHSNISKPTEAVWREQRYEFLIGQNLPIVTAHHLDDAVEWWIFSSMRGNPRLMPVVREDLEVLHPFLWSRQKEIHEKFREYPHIEDPTNIQPIHVRNYIRHEIIPRALRVNPGLHSTVKNMYMRGTHD